MRLTADQVKQGVLHPERLVRDATVRYFSQAFSDDPTVMPLAIKAVEIHGWADAFEFSWEIGRLAQTEETLVWLIDQLGQQGVPQTGKDNALCLRLSDMIARADPALLARHRQRIRTLKRLDAKQHRLIDERVRLLDMEPETCWAELQAFSERNKKERYIDKVDTGHACRLVEAIARGGGRFSDGVLSVLSQQIDDYHNHPMAWMECFVARLAGEIRLDAAAPLLAKKLKDDGGDLMNEECQRAFVKIGTDAAVDAICADWASAPWHYKLYASSSLEHIHTDHAASTCMDQAAREKKIDIEANLLRCPLNGFFSEGIEPARQFVLEKGLELRNALVTAALLLDVSFPELDQWTAKEKRNAERRDRRYEEMMRVPSRPKPKASSFESLIEPGPPAPILADGKVGRNDPCPCGSGKKYKKCCLGKK